MVIQIFLVKMVVGILITQAQKLMIADSSLLWRYLLSDKQTIHCTHSPIIRLLSQAWMGINWKQLTEEWTWFICRNCWDLHTLWFCVLVTKSLVHKYLFFCNIFLFFLELFTIEKPILWTVIYKQKTNKTFYHPLYLYLWLLKTISFCLLLCLNPTSYPWDSKAESNQIKYQIVWVFKTFSTCCYFLFNILCSFVWGTHLYMSHFLSVHLSIHLVHISGIIHHVIIIFGTHV